MKLSVLQISGARPSEPKIALHDLSLTATVADVKRLLVEKTGFPVEQQALLCGQVLADNATVEELNKDGVRLLYKRHMTIHLLTPAEGGPTELHYYYLCTAFDKIQAELVALTAIPIEHQKWVVDGKEIANLAQFMYGPFNDNLCASVSLGDKRNVQIGM